MDLEYVTSTEAVNLLNQRNVKVPDSLFFPLKTKQKQTKNHTSHRKVKEINTKGHDSCMECLWTLDFPSLNFMPLFSCLFVPY